ncbi:PspC domain-containing protein [Blastococcus sp. TF02A-30]|uniref:PspC domain-containing protein n=1 Tax=Blastococcus sp. TF02A-30 TaxID=2250580 RepID=UPI000DEA4A71|nr:PspC domain-containing protein [Blastococcus sp. TF02A-30]RBY89490.1 PspC domain-containing protein [Blastococcus sp. TF02A-30]
MTAPLNPAPAPARPVLRRSGTDRMAGGVCGGLAEYSGIDAVLWRVGFVCFAFVGGSAVLLYLLLWVLLPPAPSAADEPVSAAERLARRINGAVSGSRQRPAA